MDSVLDDGEDEDINIVPGERLPLTSHLESHGNVTALYLSYDCRIRQK